jgi:hypothetical protein
LISDFYAKNQAHRGHHIDMEKALKSLRFQGFGGDKRDRTADLLNAIGCQRFGTLRELHQVPKSIEIQYV